MLPQGHPQETVDLKVGPVMMSYNKNRTINYLQTGYSCSTTYFSFQPNSL